MVSVGRVARPHGNRGRVIIDPDTDFADTRFAPGKVVYHRAHGETARLTITDVRFHRDRPIVGFDGVETISAAETLARAELRAPVSDLPALPPGRFHHHELVGCRVETTGGLLVGTVRDVEGSEGVDRLIVGAGVGEVQVPVVDAICVEIDPVSRRIVVDPPEGLLELNLPAPRDRAGDAGDAE